MSKKVSMIILNLFVIMIIISVVLHTVNASAIRMDNYAQVNNCKYDNNGLCYNKNERPWLFENK